MRRHSGRIVHPYIGWEWLPGWSTGRVARYPHLNCNREDLGKRTTRPASGRGLV
jgi:hypothetical protein